MSNPLRTLPVEYNVEDYVALGRLIRPNWRQPARIILFVAAAILIFLSVAQLALEMPVDWWDLAETVSICFLLLIFLSDGVQARLMRRQTRRNPLYAPQQFAAEDEGLRVSSAHGEAFTRWGSLDRMERQGDRLFFFVSKRCAYILPIRAFARQSEFDEFASFAEGCIGGSGKAGEVTC